MASYPAPNNPTNIYNPIDYDNNNDDNKQNSIINAQYLKENYTPLYGEFITNYIEQINFSGIIQILNNLNATLGNASLFLHGGITILKDLFIHSGNIITDNITATLFATAETIIIGNSESTITIGNIECCDINCKICNIEEANITNLNVETDPTFNKIYSTNIENSNTMVTNRFHVNDIYGWNHSTASLFSNTTDINVGHTSGQNCNILNPNLNIKNLSCSGYINSNFPQQTLNSGNNYAGGYIHLSQPLQGSTFKLCYITCSNAKANANGDWVMTFTYNTPFSSLSTISSSQLKNVTLVPDENACLSSTLTKLTVTIKQNTTSNANFLVIGQ